MVCNSRPLKKEESRTLNNFVKLSSGDKMLELLHLMKDLLPDRVVNKFSHRPRLHLPALPFNPNKLSFEGVQGGGSMCWLYLLRSLEPNKPSWALKLLKDSYVQKLFSNADEAISTIRENYAKIRSWYGEELADIFLPEFIIELQGKEKTEVAILQQFQAAEMKDIFEELSRKELLEILKHDQQFRQQFVRFAQITLRHEQEQGEVIDLLNNKNVTLITEKNRHRLLVLDPHGVYDSRKGYKAESKTRLRLKYLEELLQEIDKM